MARPQLSDDAYQSNRRTADALRRISGVGDLPRFTTDAINTDGVKAVSEVADLIDQVHAHDPAQAKELYDKTMQGIGNGERRSLEDQIRTKEHDIERDGAGRTRTLSAHTEDGEHEIMLLDAKDADDNETLSMSDQKENDAANEQQKRLEEINEVYKERGFAGLAEEYGPEVRDALSELADYVSKSENADDVTSTAFETVLGVDPTDPSLKDAGFTAILGAMTSKRARQVKAGAKVAQEIVGKTDKVSGNSSVASKGVNMYNGPTIDRPFEKDYPDGYKADKDGNLTHDIDGRELVPGGKTVGRRVVQGSEENLAPTELNAIAEAATTRNVAQI